MISIVTPQFPAGQSAPALFLDRDDTLMVNHPYLGDPALVELKRNGATHYFSTLPDLPVEVIRELARRAGVHVYTPDTRDPAWIGNDLVFIHTATAGAKRITTPAGTKLKRILGGLPKDEYASGEAWYGEAGRTYGFKVVKK